MFICFVAVATKLSSIGGANSDVAAAAAAVGAK